MKAINLFKSLKACAWMPAALLLAGCGGTQYASDPVNPAQPFAFPGQSAPAYAGPAQTPSVAPSPALPQAPVPYAEVATNPNELTPEPGAEDEPPIDEQPNPEGNDALAVPEVYADGDGEKPEPSVEELDSRMGWRPKDEYDKPAKP